FNSILHLLFFFFSSRRRHTRSKRDWSSDVCSSDLETCRLQCPSPGPDLWRPRCERSGRSFLTHRGGNMERHPTLAAASLANGNQGRQSHLGKACPGGLVRGDPAWSGWHREGGPLKT